MNLIGLASPLDRYSSLFRFNGEGNVKIIEDPSQSMIIGNNELFWDGHYRPTPGRPIHCAMKLAAKDFPLGEFRYLNGSTPHALHYSCPFGSRCVRLTCVDESFWIPATVSLCMLALFVGCIFKVFCVEPNEDRHKEYELALQPQAPVFITIDKVAEDEPMEEIVPVDPSLLNTDAMATLVIHPSCNVTVSVGENPHK
ncbi:hypothetical protein CAEBREN_09668 [Caenorhabditis brenneri]|uniref:CX domain-containing protein n=1 Tax=Caenorhabditis brenneri TaxID=135651 RepID=G0MTT7_CAEBE|nr:hypothetical protein CAEBREN_09668 [Caenorhabditis brenneri]